MNNDEDPLASLSDPAGRWAPLKARLEALRQSEVDPDSRHAWLCVDHALRAAAEGNFGVGSVLVDPEGNVVAAGGNRVFEPRFDSSAHAEMVVMDEFESAHANITRIGKYTLFTSLESCPMCLTRLITSGVGAVVHVAADEFGGMVHKFDELPRAWRTIAEGRNFRESTCAEELKKISEEIFVATVRDLDRRLKERQ